MKFIGSSVLYIFVSMMLMFVNADELFINKPTGISSVVGNSVEVDVSIIRNGMLNIQNFTTELYDKNGNYISNVFTDTSVGNKFKFEMNTGGNEEFDLKIISVGRYLSINPGVNGSIDPIMNYMTNEYVIPIRKNKEEIPDQIKEQIPVPDKTTSSMTTPTQTRISRLPYPDSSASSIKSYSGLVMVGIMIFVV